MIRFTRSIQVSSCLLGEMEDSADVLTLVNDNEKEEQVIQDEGEEEAEANETSGLKD